MTLLRYFARLEFPLLRMRYRLYERWRYGSLLDGPIGERVKVHFEIEEPDGPGGESLWAERVERSSYKLLNNGVFVSVATGDIVRVKVNWPMLEVLEVVERARKTWVLEFVPLPTLDECQAIAEAIEARGGRTEWFHAGLLSVAVRLVDDPSEVCRDVLGPGVELLG